MIDYRFVGWCNEGNSDKVWGIIYINESVSEVLTFWGKRGSKLQTKFHKVGAGPVYDLIREKKKKGYRSISLQQLNDVYPNFEKDLEKITIWATLKA